MDPSQQPFNQFDLRKQSGEKCVYCSSDQFMKVRSLRSSSTGLMQGSKLITKRSNACAIIIIKDLLSLFTVLLQVRSDVEKLKVCSAVIYF